MRSENADATERRAKVQEILREHADAIPEVFREPMLALQIVVGMNPHMARLVGGAHAYKVEADPDRWPTGYFPPHVIDAQSRDPDKSRIWLTFRNENQFPEKGETTFRVYIESGKVQGIEQF